MHPSRARYHHGDTLETFLARAFLNYSFFLETGKWKIEIRLSFRFHIEKLVNIFLSHFLELGRDDYRTDQIQFFQQLIRIRFILSNSMIWISHVFIEEILNRKTKLNFRSTLNPFEQYFFKSKVLSLFNPSVINTKLATRTENTANSFPTNVKRSSKWSWEKAT